MVLGLAVLFKKPMKSDLRLTFVQLSKAYKFYSDLLINEVCCL